MALELRCMRFQHRLKKKLLGLLWLLSPASFALFMTATGLLKQVRQRATQTSECSHDKQTQRDHAPHLRHTR
jgi:hypothetical protein